MKRSKKIERAEGETKWKKVGGGSLRLGRRIIKAGQTFYADQADIPESFLNVLENLDGDIEKTEEVKAKRVSTKKIKATVYTLQLNEEASLEDKPLYDIVGKDDKVINEQPLSKEEAEATIEALK